MTVVLFGILIGCIICGFLMWLTENEELYFMLIPASIIVFFIGAIVEITK
jgi:nitrogen fixation-related uncharacterized protein